VAAVLISLPEALPELPISPYTNYVTARGMAQLQARLDDVEAQLAELGSDAQFDRDYLSRHGRWLRARIQGAVPVSLRVVGTDAVAFGATVLVRESEGRESSYRIVGEDEADAERQLLSWVSPLARALEGAHVGETVHWRKADEDCSLQVLAIDFSDLFPAR
jgi:transcription elongation GreA/GreB family factor